MYLKVKIETTLTYKKGHSSPILEGFVLPFYCYNYIVLVSECPCSTVIGSIQYLDTFLAETKMLFRIHSHKAFEIVSHAPKPQ